MGFPAHFAAASVVVVLASLVMHVPGQQMNMGDIYKICMEESNSTEEEVSAFKTSQTIPASQHGKCFMACLFRHTGVTTKDGQYDSEGVYKLAKQSYASKPDKLMKARQVIDICAREVKDVDDKCEVAVVLANCTMVTSMKLGLESG